jgi:hypothetical protein
MCAGGKKILIECRKIPVARKGKKSFHVKEEGRLRRRSNSTG